MKKSRFYAPIHPMRLLNFALERKWSLLTFAFAFALFGIFIEFTNELNEADNKAQVARLDGKVLRAVAELRVDFLNGIAVDLTALGSFTVLAIFTVMGLIILHFLKDRRGALYLLLGSAGSGLLSSFMKNFISRERPTEVEKLVSVSSYSYPSGHSLAASAFYLLVSFLIFRAFKNLRDRLIIFIFSSVLIFAIGFSRIYLGVHYPSDVIGGMLLGSAWTFFLTAVFWGEAGKGRSPSPANEN